MVTAANPYAADAGIAMLGAGGNAVDAAIATHLVLGLVEPQSSGLGGGAFLLHFDYATKAMTFFDGRETAPAGAKVDMFMGEDGVLGFFEAVQSGHAVGAPGVVRLYEMVHARYGALPWAALFEPALRLARDGFPGVLISLRGLRNSRLAEAAGDQDEAGRRIAEASGEGVGDDEALLQVCLPATGLPYTLAELLWHRVRRVGLLCEVLGHDAGGCSARVLCAVGGVLTTAEPNETAALHALWYALCHSEAHTELLLDAIVAALIDVEGRAYDAMLAFLPTGRRLDELEWDVPAELASPAHAKVIAKELLRDPDRQRRAYSTQDLNV